MYNAKFIYNLDEIKNQRTLNIFCDASMRCMNKSAIGAGCYGVVAVCMDDVIDKMYRIHNNTTSNQEELRGLRGALRFAIKYHEYFERINIFSDSLYSLNSLRFYDCLTYSPDKQLSIKHDTKNKALVIENVQILIKLLSLHHNVNFYHQNGHVNYNKEKKLVSVSKRFKILNKMNRNEKIDLNVIRYISIYNDMVDHDSRSLLYRTNVIDNEFKDAVHFLNINKISL